jgi:hypothetical protein
MSSLCILRSNLPEGKPDEEWRLAVATIRSEHVELSGLSVFTVLLAGGVDTITTNSMSMWWPMCYRAPCTVTTPYSSPDTRLAGVVRTNHCDLAIAILLSFLALGLPILYKRFS